MIRLIVPGWHPHVERRRKKAETQEKVDVQADLGDMQSPVGRFLEDLADKLPKGGVDGGDSD